MYLICEIFEWIVCRCQWWQKKSLNTEIIYNTNKFYDKSNQIINNKNNYKDIIGVSMHWQRIVQQLKKKKKHWLEQILCVYCYKTLLIQCIVSSTVKLKKNTVDDKLVFISSLETQQKEIMQTKERKREISEQKRKLFISVQHFTPKEDSVPDSVYRECSFIYLVQLIFVFVSFILSFLLWEYLKINVLWTHFCA